LYSDTSIVPPLIYAVMGSSRDIAIGPVAVVSMLLSSLVTKVIDPAANPHAYRDFVFTVTFFTGIFQAAFGIFRLFLHCISLYFPYNLLSMALIICKSFTFQIH
jgi:MFS superfamily sulfate permease-like transporter